MATPRQDDETMTNDERSLKFSEKRQQWLEVLAGKDTHSINNQLTRMTWDDVSFRMIDEARRLAPVGDEENLQINGMMHDLLNRCFFDSYMAAIRRLVDNFHQEGRPPWEGRRGVYSLAGLLEDMKSHYYLFTRKAIFDAEGLEYDYEKIKNKADAKSYWEPEELDWERHSSRHESIDRLVGVSPENRNSEDSIGIEVFENIMARVDDTSRRIKNCVDKFIAHPAAPESRAEIEADEITLGEIWKAHQVLCRITNFMSIELLGDRSMRFLPIPQYNQFKYIDQPLIETSRIEYLVEKWNEYDREFSEDTEWTLDDYENEFGKLD